MYVPFVLFLPVPVIFQALVPLFRSRKSEIPVAHTHTQKKLSACMPLSPGLYQAYIRMEYSIDQMSIWI